MKQWEVTQNMNKYVRKRGRLVSFWTTEEESKLINDLVLISGLTKQDYILGKLANREINVYGNSRVYAMLKRKLEEVLEELKRIDSYDEGKPEIWILIEQINKTLYGLKNNI